MLRHPNYDDIFYGQFLNMELLFLAILVLLMAFALGSGYPVAFALPGSSIITILLAALCGYLFTGNVDAYFALGGPGQWLSAGVTNLRGVYWEPERDTLIAIPLFIFMGIMLQRSKIAEDLLITMAQLFGPIPGGLGISVVFVGALLAATTGIVGATVVAMGLISLPVMLRNNYSPSLATGTIAASGTLGQIIPPSIVLIILADQLSSAADQAGSMRKALHKASTGELSMPSAFDVGSTSAGEMFLGAFVPGILLVLLYMAFILIYAFFKPKAAPAIAFEGSYNREFLGKVLITLVPPLTLILLVLGSIIGGIATVNQAGAIGAAGALVMAGYRLHEGKPRTYWPVLLAIISLIAIAIILSNYNTNIKNIKTPDDKLGVTLALIATFGLVVSLIWSGWRAFKIDNTLHGVMIETAKTTSLVFIILLGAAMLTAAFRAFGGEELVRHFLESLPGGFWSKFIVVMGVIFILGFFLDFIEIAVVVVPIVAPILLADPSANVTAVWLGVMIGLNIQTSFLTPPFGFALFYLRGVAPATVKTIQMYRGVIAFIGLQLLALGIVGAFPSLVNYLPNRVSLLSETAPPPRNPKLQYCVEEMLTGYYSENGDRITRAIATAQELDLSVLPKKLKKNLENGFTEAGSAMELLAKAIEAEQVISAASPGYRSIHDEVRELQRGMFQITKDNKDLSTRISRLRDESDKPERQRLEALLQGNKDEIAKLEGMIPAGWDDAFKQYIVLVKTEQKARLTYRRAADEAYEPLQNVLFILDDAEKLDALESELFEFKAKISASEPHDMVAPLANFSKLLNKVAGTGSLRSAISKARRALKSRNPNKEKALAAIEKAEAIFAEDKAWRAKAVETLKPSLEKYDDVIRGNIGLRLQSRLSREQALYVASCGSGHRDVSLNF